MDYNLAWDREVLKVVKVAGELQEKWAAHLYLKKMRLQAIQKSQVLTVTLGKYTVDALKRAALITFPSMKEAFARKDNAKPSFSTRRPPFKGRARHNDRYPKGKKPWRANEANQDDDDDGEDSDEDEHAEEESDNASVQSEEPPPEEEELEECPPELDEALERLRHS